MGEERFCPKCKSEDIELQLSNLYGVPGNWVCNKCGFYNANFPVKDKLKEEKNKNGKEKI